jgi:hypothetical protein
MDPAKFACGPLGLLELSGGETVATLTGKEMLFMSRPEVPKISLRAVERKRGELDSQRALLHRTLREAPSIEEMMDVFRALETTLHSPRKNAGQR